MVKLLYDLQPDEIYNLGAQSHVRVSFDIPEYTGDVVGLGTVRILEAIREAGMVKKNSLLSSFLLRDVRPRAGSPSNRENTILASKPIFLRQGLCLLANGELPGILQFACKQRHPV